MKPNFILYTLLFISISVWGQKDTSLIKRLDFTGDFRFRIEQDWNGVNANGVELEDRGRLRYRFRFGLNFQLDAHSSFGARVRSGNLNDQQGPHVTLGGGNGEFGLVQVGFEKLFYQYKRKGLTAWVGKNTVPFKRVNELFWNNNVFPEGVSISYQFPEINGRFLNSVSFVGSHFIIKSNNGAFKDDSYLQVAQLDLGILNDKVHLFPGIYFFNNVGNYPDSKETYQLDYSLLHLGGELMLLRNSKLTIAAEYYQNLQSYAQHDSIPNLFQDQKQGWVLSAKWGTLKKKGDFILQVYYAHLQKYSIVDYFAQNDWVRWDYSDVEASGARITNFQGFETRFGYAFRERFNLILRAYFVEELIKSGRVKEKGARIRLDMNIGF